MSSSTENLIITSEMITDRLDRLLTSHFPAYSRSYFQRLIEEGFVLINGVVVKKKEKPKVGDEIEICFQLTPEMNLEPENIPLDILYEDEYLLAINKPAGMVTHPAPGNYTGTFVHALLYHCKSLPGSDTLRPGIVHRLDKNTTGVLLAAKTLEAHQRLVEMFSRREVEKIYLAVCVGNPGEKTIEAPIKRHVTKRKEMCVDPEGKPAISRCKVLRSNEKLALVEIQIMTGRTHQIRVHLKHLGTPILGDPVYGSPVWNKKYAVDQQILHAYRLKFKHPITGVLMEIEAPIPSSLKNFP